MIFINQEFTVQTLIDFLSRTENNLIRNQRILADALIAVWQTPFFELPSNIVKLSLKRHSVTTV